MKLTRPYAIRVSSGARVEMFARLAIACASAVVIIIDVKLVVKMSKRSKLSESVLDQLKRVSSI